MKWLYWNAFSGKEARIMNKNQRDFMGYQIFMNLGSGNNAGGSGMGGWNLFDYYYFVMPCWELLGGNITRKCKGEVYEKNC